MIIKSKGRQPDLTYLLVKIMKLTHQMIGELINSNMNYNNQSVFKTKKNQQLRGGGFAISSCRFGQAPQEQEIQNLTENMTQYEKALPSNFQNEFDDSVNDIKEGFGNLFNNSIKNKIKIRIQWFSYNKNIFNKLCIQSEIKPDLKNKILVNLNYLLDALPNYLEVSWFLSYQIAQICNDLLRILYSQKLDDPQDILKKVKYFCKQLSNESDNIWKGGLEFECSLMDIMLTNLKQPGEELDLLKKLGKSFGESILEGKITKSLLSSLKKGAKYLVKKTINKGLYPIEVYQTYYLFQIIKWRIIETDSQSVYSSIQTLKGLFQQYIQESNNWILHFCWIQTITDIILYRPIIDQELLQQQHLQETTMIQELAFDHKKAIILFFDQQLNPSLNSILSNYRKNELQLLCKTLIDEQFTQDQNLWDYYTNFHFIYSEKVDVKQNSIIQLEREQELLKSQFEQLKELFDQIKLTQIEIQETLIRQAVKTELSKQLFDDHKNRLSCTYYDLWKKAIYLINLILDFLNFDYEKLQILKNLEQFCTDQTFQQHFNTIKIFVEEEFPQFQQRFLKDFLDQISFISNFAFLEQEEIKLNNQYKQIKIQENLPLNSFLQFLDALHQLQIFIDLKNENNNVKITNLNQQNINQFFKQIIEGNWIRYIITNIQDQFQEKFQFMDDLNEISEIKNQIIKCQISISTISFLKQFYEVQIEKIKWIKRKFQMYLNQDQQQNHINELSFLKRFNDLLKKQNEKLTSFRENVSQNFNVDMIKQNFELIDLEIDSDIKTIKTEIQKKKEKTEEKACIEEKYYKKGIKLLLDFQALFIIFLSLINETKHKSQDKSNNNNLLIQEEQYLEKQGQEFLKKLDKLLSNFKEFIKIIEESKEPEKQQDNSLYFEIQCCEYWYISYEKTINQLKNAMKFYQSYKKFLLIYSNLFYYSDSLQQSQQFENDSFRGQIIDFRNQNKECIDQLEDSIKTQFKDSKIQVEKPNHNLTLIQFLTFFEMEANEEQNENQAEDEMNVEVLSEIKDYFLLKKNELENIIEAKDYKVGECLVYNLIRLQNSNLEDEIINFASQKLQQIWVYEQNQRVRSLLKNKELIDMQKQIFQRDIQTMSEQIKQQIQYKMQRLENLQQQIRLQGNPQEREKLQLELKLCYQQLDESIDNVSEMSEAMNITLMFLKDISKDVKSIKISIDNLQTSLQDIGNDIRKLRGKKYDELLQIRKQKILQQAQLQKVDSIYVQLQTIERNPLDGSLKPGSFLLKEQIQDQNGEVNEFIWHETQENKDNTGEKDVMLLSGFAGSGKSRAAKKIEEFIWQSQGIQSEWIPIYVSLPTLKNPKYNLLDQALESENYQFDKYQIKEFKDAICKKKAKVVLILDSYDEMKQDCIQQNLIMTNKLIQDLNIEKNDRQLKIIITTRREILNTDGYETWFYGESLKTLKEVQLLNFNQEQQNKYLEKYCKLSIKRTLRRTYEFVKQVQGQNFDLAEFIKIWNSILNQVKQCLLNSKINGLDSIFQNQQQEMIIKKIKQQAVFKYLSDEQITGFRKDLLNLWSVNKFIKSINSVNIQNLLTTPFMLEIIVQVLPSMTKKYQGSIEIKENFRQFYLSINKRAKLSRNQIQQFKLKMEESLKNKQENQINYQQQENKSIIKSSRIQQTQKKQKIDQIIDSLDSIQFFQFYSIDSNIQLKEGKINIDGQNLQVSVNNLDIVVMALKIKQITAFEFYESFISFYHEQQILKQRELGKVSNYESFAKDIQQFSQSLALDLTIKDLSQINYKQKGQLLLQSNYKATQEVDNWLDQYLSDSNSDKEYKKLIRSCILLSNKGSTYQFTHKSIQEFFVAQYVYNFLVSLGNLNQNKEFYNLEHLINSLFNSPTFNLSCEAFRGANYFIKDKLLNTNINQKMIDIVLLSSKKEFCRAASNSIYLLSQMNIYLGSQNFSSIQLADTNISGLSFFESDFSNSIFQNVTINSCNFNQTNLSDIMWNDVICKEKPYLAGQKLCFKAVAFSSDGRYIASGGEEGIVKLWNPQTYMFIQNLMPNHESCIQQLQFSSDSQFLISCDQGGKIKFWDLLNFTQKQIKVPDFIEKIQKFQLSEDCKKIFILTENIFVIQDFDILFLETENQKEQEINQFLVSLINKNLDNVLFNVNIIPNLSKFTKLLDNFDLNTKIIVFSPDGKLIAVADELMIKIWELQTNSFIEYLTEFNVFSLQFTSDNKSLILGGKRTFKVKEINSFKINEKIAQKVTCQEVYISPINNQIIAIVIEKEIQIIDIQSNNLLNNKKFDLQPKNIIISQDGYKLALIFKNEKNYIVEFLILYFDNLNTIIKTKWDDNLFNSYFLSDDLSRMYLSGQEKTFELNLQIKIGNPQLFKLKKNLEAQIFCVKPQNQIMAYVESETQSIFLFNILTEKQIGQELRNGQKEVQALCFSPNQNILAVGYQDAQLLVWNLDTYKHQQIVFQKIISQDQQIDLNLEQLTEYTLNLHKSDKFEQLIFSPNGKLFAINGFDNLYVYETQSWNLIKFKMNLIIVQINFSHDNIYLVVISYNSKYFCNIENNYQLTYQSPKEFHYYKIFLTIDSNIQIYADQESIILFDVSTQIMKSKKLVGSIKYISISQNNCIMAVAIQLNDNSIIQIWNYSNNELEIIASELFSFQIIQISFINNDQELLLQFYEEDRFKIKFYLINHFQFKSIENQRFNCGAFSKKTQIIALGYYKQISILTDKLESCLKAIDFNQDINERTLVQFIQNDQIIVCGSQDGLISFCNFLEQKCHLTNFKISYNSILKIQFIKNDSILIILDEKGNLSVFWVLYAQNQINISFIGYYEVINFFSASLDGERFIGIKNNQYIINLNESNFDFCLTNIQVELQKIYFSFCMNFLIILDSQHQIKIYYKELQFNQINEQIEKVEDADLHPRLNLLAIYTEEQEIKLIQFSAIKWQVIFSIRSFTVFIQDSFHGNYNLKFTQNGQILVLIDNSLIRWYQVQKNRTLKVMGFVTQEYVRNPIQSDQRIYLFDSKYLAYISKQNKGLRWVDVKDEKITVSNIVGQNVQVLLGRNYTYLNSNHFSISQGEQIVYFHCSISVYAFDIQDMIMYKIRYRSEIEDIQDKIMHKICCQIEIEDIQAIDNRSLIIVFYDSNKKVRCFQQLNWDLSDEGQINKSHSEIGTTLKKFIGTSFYPLQQLWAVILENDIIIKLWNVKAKKIINIFQGHRQIINNLTFSSDGLILATASEDQSIRLWNIDFIEQIDPSAGHRDTINDIAFSKDGLLVASCSRDKTIILWDLLDKKFIVQLEGHQQIINCLQFSYCSKFLYSGSDDKSIRVWNIENPWQSKLINIYFINDFPMKSIYLSPIDPNMFIIRYYNSVQIINQEDIQTFCDLLPSAYFLNFKNNDELIYLVDDSSSYYKSDYKKDLLIYDINKRKSTLIKQKYYPRTQIICSNNQILELQIQIFFEGEITILQKNYNQNWIEINNVCLPLAEKIMLSPDYQTLVLQTNKILSFWKFEFLKSKVLDKSYELELIQKGRFPLYTTISSFCSFATFYYYEREIKFIDINNSLESVNYTTFDGINKVEHLRNYQLEDICFSFDMKYIAAVFYQEHSVIYFWEVIKPDQLYRLNAENNIQIITLQFSSIDSHIIYSAYSNCEIIKWNLQTLESKFLTRFQSLDLQQAQQVLFSSQFHYLIFMKTYSDIILIDLKQQIQIENIESIQQAYKFCFSEDESLIAYANQNELWLCCILNSRLIEKDKFNLFQTEFIKSIQFFLNEKLLVWQVYNHQYENEYHLISVFEIQLNQKLRILDCFQIKDKISDFKYHQIKQQLVVLCKSKIYFFNILNRIIGQTIKFEDTPKYCFSSDSQYFVLLNPNLSLRDTKEFEEIKSFNYEGDQLDFQKCNENLILVIAQGKLLRFLDFSNIDDIKEVQTLDFDIQIISVQLTSKYCLTQHYIRNQQSDYLFQIHDIQNLPHIFKSDIYSGQNAILSKNSQYLAYSNNINTKIIKTYTKHLYEDKEPDDNLNFISQSPSGKYLAIQTKNSVLILNYNSMEQIHKQFLSETLIDFSENWKFMAFSDKGKIKIKEIQNECQFLENEKLELYEENYSLITFSLSQIGNYLASGNINEVKNECKIILWDVEKCKLIAQSGNLDSYVKHIKFCPDGITFAAALENGPLHLYQIKENFQEISISCFKSIARQSTLLAHKSILTKKSQVMKSQNSIRELFIQKGAILKDN
ncbi:unnamed protein product [Paramecium sonneborni]|uniref:NACHT domain-containing protein n=1 Tax=Paramecium sonneborni TaxID=65129 RepID=A0A8S1MSB4_9CILI|nr:unnamed protein product [Paramecium sonneborni]